MKFNENDYELFGEPIPINKHTIKIGDSFGKLTVFSLPFWLVTKRKPKRGSRQLLIFAEFLCECSNVFTCSVYDVKNNRKTSCGCDTIKRQRDSHLKGSALNDGFKKCSTCLETLEHTCFYKYKRSYDGMKGQCRNCYYAGRIKKLFNIDIDSILADTNLACEICKRTVLTPNDCQKNKALRIDHCHKSGKFRGVLCDSCNFALGLMNENITSMENMIQYIKKHTNSKP